MVGKIKRARQKLHHVAVRVPSAEDNVPGYKVPTEPGSPRFLSTEKAEGGKDWSIFSSNIFSSTKIEIKQLTQKLEVDAQSLAPVKKEEKIQLPKKEKIKQRRERWLQKIETLNLAQQAKKAQAKRKATPIVGDMQPLMDALPELSELTSSRKPKARRKQPKDLLRMIGPLHCIAPGRIMGGMVLHSTTIRTVKKKKPEPTDYRKMRPAQKRKLIEEEVSRVQDLIRNSTYKANPLSAVSEHLLKRMKAEQGNPI